MLEYHQLRLFLDDLDHNLGIEPLHLEEYFRAVQRWYQYRLDFEGWQLDYQRWQADRTKRGTKVEPPPVAPEQPREPVATIEQVLNPIFISPAQKGHPGALR